ncbi:MAG: DUF6138 family protein [Methanomassiliicoccaceae archaeon]|nr:DUF6138 family protein [Methanomassiliicoccaceae archaeon]
MEANERRYLIFRDVVKDPSLKPYFDACVEAVSNGTARIVEAPPHPGYAEPDCLDGGGRLVLFDSVLPYFLHELDSKGFDSGKARDFTERMRRFVGFYFIQYPMTQWVYGRLRDPYFDKRGSGLDEEWTLKQDEARAPIPDDVFDFACYVATLHMKHGTSSHSVTAEDIFGIVAALGSDIPERMKKHGSGDMPLELLELKGTGVSCKANDAFATIKITVKEDGEEHYGRALDFLCALLEADFPRSYSIGFRGPVKSALPIKGLPKCGPHSLFANAARYEGLHGKMERYARLAMKEYEWYNDLEGDDDCAMPGTFAVFALGMSSERHAPLVLDYLALCDDEHSSIQGKFIAAYIGRFGFTESSVRVFLAAVESMQELPTNKAYAAAVGDRDSLTRMLDAKEGVDRYTWQGVLYALWGKDAANGVGGDVLKKADPGLRPLYEEMLRLPEDTEE